MHFAKNSSVQGPDYISLDPNFLLQTGCPKTTMRKGKTSPSGILTSE